MGCVNIAAKSILMPGSPAFARMKMGECHMSRIFILAFATLTFGLSPVPLRAAGSAASAGVRAAGSSRRNRSSCRHRRPSRRCRARVRVTAGSTLATTTPVAPTISARTAHAPARRTHHRRTHASRTAHKARAAMHFSKKTIRSCHGMTYRQIMRHNSCRALMKQELAAPAHRHRTSHRAIHHKASANHKIARHHKANAAQALVVRELPVIATRRASAGRGRRGS